MKLTNDLKERELYTLWRKRNKVTLDEVAEYIGVNKSTISRWERYEMDFYDKKELKYDEFIQKFESKRDVA